MLLSNSQLDNIIAARDFVAESKAKVIAVKPRTGGNTDVLAMTRAGRRWYRVKTIRREVASCEAIKGDEV